MLLFVGYLTLRVRSMYSLYLTKRAFSRQGVRRGPATIVEMNGARYENAFIPFLRFSRDNGLIFRLRIRYIRIVSLAIFQRQLRLNGRLLTVIVVRFITREFSVTTVTRRYENFERTIPLKI